MIVYGPAMSSMVMSMAKTEKVTVTLTLEQVAQIRARVAGGDFDSVSGFVQHAVQQSLDAAAKFRALLEQDLLDTGGPLTEQEIAWADAVLGHDGPPRDPGPYPYPEGRRRP